MITTTNIDAFNKLCQRKANAIRELLGRACDYTDARELAERVMVEVGRDEEELIISSAKYLMEIKQQGAGM